MNKDDSTILITDITKALQSADREAEEKPATLLIVGGDLNGTIFDLKAGSTVCGRSAEAEGEETLITLDYQGISRRHFNITSNDGINFIINDLNSKNGTFVNNQKVEKPRQLQKGDNINVGVIQMKFLPKGDPERLTYDKLNLEATTDGLTSCYNKMYFNNECDAEVKKCKTTGHPLTLILFDLDHFKNLNDTYGHDAGDYTLKEMAEVIRQNGVRQHDTFARYGGEEFVILLPDTNLKQGFDIARRFRKAIEEHHFIYDGKRLPVTASIGVADYREGVLTGTDLFKRADNAVYQSKENGRNQVNFYRE